ncbi:hypothetical protein FHQ18_07600 [Deferribacter autotrophicus]|uniref:Site-specific integrase n=1 Tax=Deferribacter autotrophicus TaxID=500465 RepID=A0A5A8F4I1_9BACT|nr:tyrosine-type recombinase/integrase [Deferribacter autotrophicus]KAA0258249.1 hypothetical protein FHQ18_07600 [Deferribacter autotrophicus]
MKGLYFKCSKCKKFISLYKKDFKKINYCPKCNEKLNKIFYIRIKKNNKTIFKSTGTSKKTEAERFLLKILNEDKELLKIQQKIKSLKFSEFLDNYYIPYYKTKNKSYEIEKYRINIIKDYFNDKLLESIKPIDIDTFFQFLKNEKNVNNLDRYISRLKNMFNYAIKMDFINSNPVKAKQSQRVEIINNILSLEEIEKLLKVAKLNKNRQLYYIILIAVYTGMRKSEILSLKVNNFDFDNEIITLESKNTKSKKTRFIPILSRLKDEIQEYIKTTGLKKNDNLFTVKDIQGSFKTCLKYAGIDENFRFHDLRHTFASICIQNGLNLYEIKEILGHSDFKVTQRYAHLNQRKLIDKLQQVFQSD